MLSRLMLTISAEVSLELTVSHEQEVCVSKND
jgi:hypothetical protein